MGDEQHQVEAAVARFRERFEGEPEVVAVAPCRVNLLGEHIDYTGGLNEDGQMVLEGQIDNYQPNSSTRFRGIWTPEENGDVIQRFEAYDAEHDRWNVWFEGRYVKQ